MLTTTLKKLRKYEACENRYDHLVAALGDEYGDDTPLSVSRILDINGISDALWALRACDMSQKDKNAVYLLACDYAEHVLHIFEDKYPDNPYPRAAIEARRAWVRGEISYGELKRSADAARTAARAAYFAAAARAAYFAAACAAAYAAATATDAYSYAYSAADAAYAADSAAAVPTAAATYSAAYAAATALIAAETSAAYADSAYADSAAEAEKRWQAQKLREIL